MGMIRTQWNTAYYTPPKKTSEKMGSSIRVFAALAAGAETTNQVAAHMGVSRNTAKGYLHTLKAEGFVVAKPVLGKETIWRKK